MVTGLDFLHPINPESEVSCYLYRVFEFDGVIYPHESDRTPWGLDVSGRRK